MSKTIEDMILKIEYIPIETHGINVRTKMSQDDWDILRRYVYQAANYKCDICGGKGKRWPVECHEVWEYNTEKRTQILVQLQALCPLCHQCKHMGRAMKVGKKQEILKHYRKVNKIRTETQDRIIKETQKAFWARSEEVEFKNVNIIFAKNMLRDIKKEEQAARRMTFRFKKGDKRL